VRRLLHRPVGAFRNLWKPPSGISAAGRTVNTLPSPGGTRRRSGRAA
jgi:hypothetical protein